jgi:hypothetical protein
MRKGKAKTTNCFKFPKFSSFKIQIFAVNLVSSLVNTLEQKYERNLLSFDFNASLFPSPLKIIAANNWQWEFALLLIHSTYGSHTKSPAQ